LPVTRCANEPEFPRQGFAWTAPHPLEVRVETPRLSIRGYVLEDAALAFEAINASRSELVPWMLWARDQHHHPADSTKYISEQIVAMRQPDRISALGVGIFERDGDCEGAFIGGTGFHDLRRDTACAETGYWIRSDRHRRGYCTEAMRHWISFCLKPQPAGGLGLNRLRIFCSAENTGSVRVCEKLGLRKELHQRADYFVPTVGVTDRLGYGVLAEEWDHETHQRRDQGA
jgi:RimJ/RimL family protein N-acetyltransferase